MSLLTLYISKENCQKVENLIFHIPEFINDNLGYYNSVFKTLEENGSFLSSSGTVTTLIDSKDVIYVSSARPFIERIQKKCLP